MLHVTQSLFAWSANVVAFAKAGVAKRRKTHHAARNPQEEGHNQANLPTLPQELLEVIITKLKPTERLAVFRCCKALRNAVLNATLVDTRNQQLRRDGQQQQQQQGEVKQQLRTLLFVTAGKGTVCYASAWPDCVGARTQDACYIHPLGMSSSAVHKPLQLAAHSKHDVHLHIRPTQHFSSSSLTPWLSGAFHPWLMSPPITPSLQHVTSIWLYRVNLDHPLPDCIGSACPGLKAYTLWNVCWPGHLDSAAAATQPWPQLTEHTLYNYRRGMNQISRLMNGLTLPNLARLSYEGYEDLDLHTFIHSFSKHLTSLVVNNEFGKSSNVFSQLPSTKQFAVLLSADVPRTEFKDQDFIGLLQAAPALHNCL